jgi:hypothetical protein
LSKKSTHSLVSGTNNTLHKKDSNGNLNVNVRLPPTNRASDSLRNSGIYNSGSPDKKPPQTKQP